ncbi:hypothetical protein QQ045_006765 [Rhodiola kirilowii]
MFEYQVFLSFRGADVRKGFIDHLFRRLKDEGVRVFLDNIDLEHGEKITFLFEAIELSHIFLVTFSPGYCDSTWCLDELVQIIKCKTTSNCRQHVLPVFYNVEPTSVRHQTGSYEKSFTVLEDQFKDEMARVMEYRTALMQVTELRGLSLKETNWYEGQLVDNAIEEVKKRLCTRRLSVKQNIVGRDSIVRNISMWLQDGSNDVQVGMIYGPEGIGKSTVSQIVYNDNLDKFSRSCFVADFQTEAAQGRGLTFVLEQIISDISKKPSVKIYNVPSGLAQVRDVVSRRKTLLVLDDVGELSQLEAMFGDQGFFHPGSKIIITTRNQKMRKVCNFKKEFSISELSNDESIKLFSLHAFRSDQPPPEFMTLSRRFIDYCQGNPWKLCNLASSLRTETKDIWNRKLNKLLSEGPDGKVQSIPKLSFDSIKNEVAKGLFLHVPHFFVGMRKEDDAYTILEAGLELHPELGVLGLVNRCLVTVDANDKLVMHQLIQEIMSRQVVRQEARYEPGNGKGKVSPPRLPCVSTCSFGLPLLSSNHYTLGDPSGRIRSRKY